MQNSPLLLNKRVVIKHAFKDSNSRYAGLRGRIIQIKDDLYKVHFPKAEITHEMKFDIWFVRDDFEPYEK